MFILQLDIYTTNTNCKLSPATKIPTRLDDPKFLEALNIVLSILISYVIIQFHKDQTLLSRTQELSLGIILPI